MATKYGFTIESGLASNHLTDAHYVKGGYFVVKDIDARNALIVANDTVDGTIVKGSLCYCQEDDKFYIYNGITWAEKDFSEGGSIQEETDPTVPDWAKAETKPTYTAQEVGAVPTSRTVNGKALSGDITLSASDVGALPITTKVGDLENDAGYITMDDIPSIGGGGEQGPLRATNYVFENSDRFNDWWFSEDRPQVVKGDAFYITDKVEFNDGSMYAFPDYIWDGTILKETIMPYAKLPLPDWLDTGDGRMKEALSLIDIGNVPQWISDLSLTFDRGESFKNYYPFKESVDDIVAEKNYATNSEIPTLLSQLGDDETHRVVTDTEKATWNAKSNFSGDYNDLTNKPTIPTVPTNVSAFTNDANYATKDAIPTDAHINDLINTAFGGVLNGKY